MKANMRHVCVVVLLSTLVATASSGTIPTDAYSALGVAASTYTTASPVATTTYSTASSLFNLQQYLGTSSSGAAATYTAPTVSAATYAATVTTPSTASLYATAPPSIYGTGTLQAAVAQGYAPTQAQTTPDASGLSARQVQ
jgi:hypothetical protein